MLNKEEMKRSFCGWMTFLSPTSRNHSLDLIFSLSTKTPEQGKGVSPFMSALRRLYLFACNNTSKLYHCHCIQWSFWPIVSTIRLSDFHTVIYSQCKLSP